jgi:hypothetical protein
MSMLKFMILGFLAGMTTAALAASAVAQPLHAQPGSYLIYPLFNSTDGNNTVITVTNTNQSEISCGNGFRQGDVGVLFVYTDGITWAESNLEERLTPADQVVVLAAQHNPNQEAGFLTAEARDPETGLPIDFDHLIGSALVVNSEFDFQWAYTPYPFQGLPGGATPHGFDACNRPFTDVPSSGNYGTADFNGAELSSFPATLYLDQFFGEGSPASRPAVSFDNTLYLMSTSPNLTGVRLLGWNNNEKRFSRTFNFRCWTEASLGEITSAVTQANLSIEGDMDELVGVATGWLQLDPQFNSVGLLGVFVQNSRIGGQVFSAGRELQYEGNRVVTLPRFE